MKKKTAAYTYIQTFYMKHTYVLNSNTECGAVVLENIYIYIFWSIDKISHSFSTTSSFLKGNILIVAYELYQQF